MSETQIGAFIKQPDVAHLRGGNLLLSWREVKNQRS